MKLVPLTQGKFAMVSDRDWPLVRQYKWSAVNLGKRRSCWYAATRVVRRRNLRLATSVENRANARLRTDNRSGVTGVYPHSSGGWTAHAGTKYLGYFLTKQQAIRARTRGANKMFGQFARTNIRKAV